MAVLDASTQGEHDDHPDPGGEDGNEAANDLDAALPNERILHADILHGRVGLPRSHPGMKYHRLLPWLCPLERS